MISAGQAAITCTGEVSPADPTTWSSTTYGYVGKTYTGTITVNGGSELLCYRGYLGYNSSANGTATVTGNGSKWTNSDFLYLGYSGTGTLYIGASAQMISPGGSVLGFNAYSTGNATLAGNGAKWINGGELDIGTSGSGVLDIESGGLVSNAFGYVGLYAGSTGKVTVSGANSQWTNSKDLQIGYRGNGTLKVTDGGQVSNNYGYLGFYSGVAGTATVSGANSQWINNGSLYVGMYASGSLDIEAGGQASSTSGTVGYYYNSTGTATVAGAGINMDRRRLSLYWSIRQRHFEDWQRQHKRRSSRGEVPGFGLRCERLGELQH